MSLTTTLVKAEDLNSALNASDFYEKFRIVEAIADKSALETFKKYFENLKSNLTPSFQHVEHIGKAVCIDTTECCTLSEMYPKNIPNANEFKNYVESLGISDSHHVLFYDRSPTGFLASARLWWLFRYYGHENVSVLNGGLAAWKSKNLALSSEHVDFARGSFRIEEKSELIRNYDQIVANIKSKKEQLIDVRPREAYEKDHIPNASNIPTSEYVDSSTKEFKTKEELIEVFARSGIKLSEPIVTSCMTGMNACSGALAAFIAGVRNAAVYYVI